MANDPPKIDVPVFVDPLAGMSRPANGRDARRLTEAVVLLRRAVDARIENRWLTEARAFLREIDHG